MGTIRSDSYKWALKGDFDKNIVNNIRRKTNFPIPNDLYELTARQVKIDAQEKINGFLSRDFLQHCYELNDVSIKTTKNGDMTVVSSGLGVPELSFDKDSFKRSGNLNFKRELTGTAVSILGPKACRYNYGHWLIDGVARLDIIHQTINPKNIDYYLVPKLSYDFQVDTLEILGIPKEKIIELYDEDSIQCEKIYFATDPRGESSQITGIWILKFLNEALGSSASEAPPVSKRIYISRKDSSSRGIKNEDKITPILEHHGFESLTMADYPLKDKISIFRNASHVIGMSGAGFINLAFSNKNTKLIEIFPSNFVNYFYYAICAQLGFGYDYMVQKRRGLKSLVSMYHSSITVNTKELETKLKLLG